MSVYAGIAALVVSVSFFVKGAEQAGRSRLVWGGLSLGTWFAYTNFVSPGASGGIASQVLLFVALTVWETVRDRLRARA